MAQTVKRLPAMQETQVRSLDWEDPLEKEMATHSSILAWKIPWTEETGRLQSMGSQRVRHDWATSLSGGTVVKNLRADVGDLGLIPGSGRSPEVGNENPFQYSCLGNPLDTGANYYLWECYSINLWGREHILIYLKMRTFWERVRLCYKWKCEMIDVYYSGFLRNILFSI